jgi:hypothetical protein
MRIGISHEANISNTELPDFTTAIERRSVPYKGCRRKMTTSIFLVGLERDPAKAHIASALSSDDALAMASFQRSPACIHEIFFVSKSMKAISCRRCETRKEHC